MRFKSKAQQAAVMSKLRNRGLIRGREKVIAYGSEGAYHRFRLRPPTRFQPSSFRTIKPKGATHKRVIGRPWNKTTTETQAILIPKSEMKLGGKRPLDFEDYIKNPCGCVYDRMWRRWVYRCREHSRGGKTEGKWWASDLEYLKESPKGTKVKLGAGSIWMGKRGGKTLGEIELEKKLKELEETKRMDSELQRYGKPAIGGGTVWTVGDMERYFESKKLKRR